MECFLDQIGYISSFWALWKLKTKKNQLITTQCKPYSDTTTGRF